MKKEITDVELIKYASKNVEKCFGKTREEILKLYKYNPLNAQLIELISMYGKDIVIIGSTALYLQGLLNRPVGDIDIFFIKDDVNLGNVNTMMAKNEYAYVSSSSNKFTLLGNDIIVNGYETHKFKRKVDTFTTDSHYVPTFYTIIIDGTSIQVETVQSALTAKLEYLKNASLGSEPIKKTKGDFEHIHNIFSDYANTIDGNIEFPPF